jgi:2'-5' RNA ligase
VRRKRKEILGNVSKLGCGAGEFDHSDIRDDRYLFQIPIKPAECGLEPVMDNLAGYGCVEVPPEEYVHVTLADAGPEKPDGVPIESSAPEGLELGIGPLNRFNQVVFAEVHEADSDLDILHRYLTDEFDLPGQNHSQYIPHATVAHIIDGGVDELDAYIRDTQQSAEGEPHFMETYTVNNFELARYLPNKTYASETVCEYNI